MMGGLIGECPRGEQRKVVDFSGRVRIGRIAHSLYPDRLWLEGELTIVEIHFPISWSDQQCIEYLDARGGEG